MEHSSREVQAARLHLIFFGESYLGGMAGSKRIQNLIDGLLKDPDVSIVNLAVGTPPVGHSRTGAKNGVCYRFIHYRLRNPFTFLGFYYSGFRFILKNKKRGAASVLYAYDSPVPLNLPFFLLARLAGLKIVFDIVEDYELLDKQQLSLKKRLVVYMYGALMRRLHRYAHAAFAISSYLEAYLKKITQNRLLVYALPITVNFDRFPAAAPMRGQVVKLFYGGSFGQKDGLEFLLPAFEKLADHYPDVELVLTGRPPKAGMDYALRFIRRSVHQNKIKYVGYLEDEQYYKTMNACDVFCMTRINSGYAGGGFPFKLGEMLATGKPVLATAVGDVTKFLTDRQNAVVVAPGSVTAILDGLLFLVQAPGLALEIGRKGRETALQFFDTDKVTRQLKPILTAL